MKTVEALERKLTEPSLETVQMMKELDGDILILGAGGKMGPTLAKLAKNAITQAGVGKEVYAVSRFSIKEHQKDLENHGIIAIAADLMDEQELHELPDVKNIVYMVGQKFGTTGQEHLTWAMNTYLPGRVADKYRASSIVAFSTGNIYPFTPSYSGGATEEMAPNPIGEYAQSCLGRERVFSYFSHKYQTPMLFYRLNYAIDLRYGVLVDVASAVWEEREISVDMGVVNVIWQGDANNYALRSLKLCQSPPTVLNVTGPETVSTRWLAQEFGRIFGKKPRFVGEEQTKALLNNSSLAHRHFGYPKVTLREMIDWTAQWVSLGNCILSKPTHFQQREGVF